MTHNLIKTLCLITCATLITACGNETPENTSKTNNNPTTALKITHARITDKSPTANAAQTLTIATKDKSETLDPHNTESGGDTKILVQIYETLIQVDPNNVNNLKGLLAESWTVAKDKLSITFKIKSNVKFHDGSTLDAATCKYSLQRLIGKHLKAPHSPYINFYDFIKSIDVKDNKLTINLTRPVPRVALRNLTMFPAGIVSKKLLNSTKDMSNEKRTTFLAEWASGTGPFYLASYDPSNSRTRLQAFNQYHNGKPNVKAILFSQIPDSNTQIEALKSDQVQMLDEPPRPIWESLEKDPNISSVHKWWALNLCYLGINTKHEKTKDINLRRAIRTAIDRKEFTDLYYGTARETYSIVARPFAEYDPDYKPDADFASPELKKQAAIKLIDLTDAKGKKLTIYYPNDDRPYLPTPEKIADKIRQQLNSIGLDVNIQAVPNSELFRSIRTDQYELVLIGWMTDNGDPDNFYIPLASGDPKTNQPSTTNCGRVFDPEIHQELIAAQAITDRDARIQAYRKIERQYQEKYIGYVPLLNTQQGYAFGKRLKGVQVDPLGTYRFHKATLSEK